MVDTENESTGYMDVVNYDGVNKSKDSGLTSKEILSFLRGNKLTKTEMEWLTSLGIESRNEVLKAIGKVMIGR